LAGVTAKVFAGLRAFVREMLLEAGVQYHYPVRYRVVSIAVDGRLNLQIVRKTAGFPDALPISLWPGVPGGKGAPALGSTVLVQFADGDPSLPVVTHFASPTDSTFFVPTAVALDASSTVRIGEHATLIDANAGTDLAAASLGRVVCYGDVVTVGAASGAIATTGLVSRLKAK
jgi:hypothetical protein